jgi:hypothetical protein
MKNHLKKIKEDFKPKSKTEKSFKDFLNEMRKLKEENESSVRKTVFDEKEEQDKLLRILPSDVVVNFEELEVYDDLVIWGGSINDDFEFFYKVTPNKKTSSFDFKFLSGFDPTGEQAEEPDEYVEEQMKLFDIIKNYYESFSKYWRENLIR